MYLCKNVLVKYEILQGNVATDVRANLSGHRHHFITQLCVDPRAVACLVRVLKSTIWCAFSNVWWGICWCPPGLFCPYSRTLLSL